MEEDKNLQQMKDIKSLQQMHADGRINRRDFMKAVGALGITISVAGSLLNTMGLKELTTYNKMTPPIAAKRPNLKFSVALIIFER